jgi:hypothetical protein
MIKRTLWYGCLVLLCCSLGVYALTATQSSKVVLKGKPVTGNVSTTSVATPSTTPVTGSAIATKKAPAVKSETAAEVVTEDPMLHAAKVAWENFLATGTMSDADKALVLRYGAGDPGNPGNVNQGRGNDRLDNVGGPDAFGYRYKDNVSPDTATYNWIELRGDAGATWISSWVSYDDGCASAAVPIGFTFPFYGTNYTTLTPTSNGQIEFGTCTASYYSGCVGQAGMGAAILPYMFDLHLQRGGDATGNAVVGYKNFGTYFVIEYDSVGYYSTSYAGSSMKFQVILYPDGKIKMQYNTLTLVGAPSMATVGIQNAATSFLQYRCSSQGNTVMPLAAGRAIWFYQAPGLLHDFSATSITSPLPSAAFVNTPYNVTAVFTNAGQTTEAAPVKYRFNNGAIVGPENTAVIAQYITDTHTFATQITMPATPGAYQLLVWSDLATDLDRTNDTARVTINVRTCYNTAIGPDAVTLTGQTNCGNGNTYMNTCLGYYDGGEDVVYAWTVVTPGDYTITMNPYTTTYPGLLISDHCPPDSNCIAFASNSGAVPLTIACRTFAAGTYYIMVDTWPSPNCIPTFDLTIASCASARCCYGDVMNPSCQNTNAAGCTALGGVWTPGSTCELNPCPIPAPGEFCSNAIPLALNTTYTGTTVGFANDYNYVSSTGAPDVVYSYTAVPGQVPVTFSLCGSGFDTYIYLYEATCTGTPIIYNDDFCSLQSQVSCVPLTAGVTYFIVVDGFSAGSGAYSLLATPCTPCNVDSAGVTFFEPVEPWPVPGNYSWTDPDGGCNDSIPVFAGVACGESGFGKTFLYTDSISGSIYTDTDWYRLVLSTPQYVTVTATGEIAINMLLTTDVCPVSVLNSLTTTGTCSTGTFTSACLDAGVYYVFFSASGSAASSQQYDYRFEVTCTPCTPCVVTPPVGAVEENEPCGTDINGGCNSATPIFSPIACDEWVHGTSQCVGGTRDTDWYELVNTTMDSVIFTWKIVAEFPVLGFILDGTTGCATLVQLISGTAAECDTVTMSSGVLGYGTYWFWVGKSDFVDFPCKDYAAQLTCQTIDSPCNKPDSLTVYLAPDGLHTWLHFRAHDIGRYVIYESTNKNNDGDPRAGDPLFTARDTITTVTQNTTVSWTDANATVAYKNYSVLCIDCTPPPPTGRCCYGANLCATNLEADCGTLGGSWTQGLTCEANPCPVLVPQTNDECTSAYVAVAGQEYDGSTTWATGVTDITTCVYNDLIDVWFSYTPTVDGTVTIALCGSDYDSGIAAFSDCPPTAAGEVACDDDTCGNLTSQASFAATANTTYYIRVSGYSGATGNYHLLITQ